MRKSTQTRHNNIGFESSSGKNINTISKAIKSGNCFNWFAHRSDIGNIKQKNTVVAVCTFMAFTLLIY